MKITRYAIILSHVLGESYFNILEKLRDRQISFAEVYESILFYLSSSPNPELSMRFLFREIIEENEIKGKRINELMQFYKLCENNPEQQARILAELQRVQQ